MHEAGGGHQLGSVEGYSTGSNITMKHCRSPCLRRTLLLQLEEERKKLVEAINVTFGHLGSGLTDLLTDTTKLGTGIAGLTLLALGVYSTREGVRVAGKTFDRWFGTPRLVSLHAFV